MAEVPERIWVETNPDAGFYPRATSLKPTSGEWAEFIRLDVHEAAVKEARREVWNIAITTAAIEPNTALIKRRLVEARDTDLIEAAAKEGEK